MLQSERAELEGELSALREELLRTEQEKVSAAAERSALQESLTNTERDRSKVGTAGEPDHYRVDQEQGGYRAGRTAGEPD